MERIDSRTPRMITRLCDFPYIHFTSREMGQTILDIACGYPRWEILRSKFTTAFCVDIVKLDHGVTEGSILGIPLRDKRVEVSYCFETIEHLESPRKAIQELERVTQRKIYVGSVNRTGPSWINGIKIYKGQRNPYHINELSTEEFVELFSQYENKKFYGSLYCQQQNEFYMNPGIHPDCLCNYVEIILK